MDALKEYTNNRNALYDKMEIFQIPQTGENIEFVINNTLTFDLFQFFDKEACSEIKSHLLKSSFGCKKQRLFDETVRKSFETKNIKLDCRIEFNEGFLQLYKLVLYEEGCFFDWHLDTDEQYLVGTVVIPLKSEYEGGRLAFKDQSGKEFYFSDSERSMEQKWLMACFFPQYIPHKVEQVTKGNKLSLIYKVKDSCGVPRLRFISKEVNSFKIRIEELVKKVNVKVTDVIWTTNEIVAKSFKKLNQDIKVYKYTAVEKVQISSIVYPKEKFQKLLEDLSGYDSDGDPLDSALDECAKQLEITDIIPDKENWEIGKYEHEYGWTGNSPAHEDKEISYLNGYVILHKNYAKENMTEDENSVTSSSS